MESKILKQVATIVVVDDDCRALVSVRIGGEKRYIGFYQLPGGKVDSGETPLMAAVRELREETGLIVSQKALIPLFTRTLPSGWLASFYGVPLPKGQLPQHMEPSMHEPWLWTSEEQVDEIDRQGKILPYSGEAVYTFNLMKRMQSKDHAQASSD